MRKTTVPIALALAAALAGAGCADGPVETTAESSASTAAADPPTTSTGECEIEGRTIEVALSAYRAATGELPSDLGVLAPDWLKEAPSDEWVLRVDGDDYDLRGPCPLPDRPVVTSTSGTDSAGD